MNDVDPYLGRLFDEAADSYQPAFDPARLQRAIAGRRRRGFIVLAGVAAGLAVIGGSVFAFHADRDAGRLQPADGDSSTSTERKTEPPFGHITTIARDETSTTRAEGDRETSSTTKNTEPKHDATTTKPTTTEPPATHPTVPTSSTPATVEFTVIQNNESTSTSPAVAVFHGTATPGDTISVESFYGSTTVTAGEAGLWEAHLQFSGEPLDTPFRVGVRHNDLLTKFWFTHTTPV